MSTKWYTVCTKFTEDELRIIDQACVKYKTNRSQIIREFLKLGLKIDEYSEIITNPNSPMTKTVSPIIKTIFNKKIMKKIEKEIEKKESKIPTDVKQKAINAIHNTNAKFRVFEKHNPVGAPSQKPGKRGRPSKKEQIL
jgi:hypothetical protein